MARKKRIPYTTLNAILRGKHITVRSLEKVLNALQLELVLQTTPKIDLPDGTNRSSSFYNKDSDSPRY